VMARIARCTQAEILPSIESQFSRPTMGTCGMLKIEDFHPKAPQNYSEISLENDQRRSLAFFEDCMPRLSCAILLTGPRVFELKKAKRVIRSILSPIYSAKLELAMLKIMRLNLNHVSIGKSDTTCNLCSKNVSPTTKNDIIYISPFIRVENCDFPLETTNGSWEDEAKSDEKRMFHQLQS